MSSNKVSECLIAFGGNLSNPKVTFQLALATLGTRGFTWRRKSGLWRSPAWPAGSDQPDYLNAVVSGIYDGEPDALLKELHDVEAGFGRKRGELNAARTLDLDLLTFGHLRCQTETLTLPHPRMLKRAFVLIPASEIQPKWLHHVRNLSDGDIRATRYVGSW